MASFACPLLSSYRELLTTLLESSTVYRRPLFTSLINMNKIYALIIIFSLQPIIAIAQSIPTCPSPTSWTSRELALSELAPLNKISEETDRSDRCKPKLESTVIFGLPLCLFNGKIPVTAAIIASTPEGELASVGYMFDYSQSQSELAISSLAAQYEKIDLRYHPSGRKMSGHRDVVASFIMGDNFIFVTDPTHNSYDRAPGDNWSIIEYTRKPYLAIIDRDSNTCN